MRKEQASLVGTTLGERYRVVREIGQGAMGTVYEARHPLIGRRFAIKVLHNSCSTPSQRERFLHEARAAGAISHPHIVQVQDFGIAPDGAPYLVMEFVDGIDLQWHLETQGLLPFDQALEIAAQMLSALEVIHGAGLVHRDIKPANIMLVRGSRPRTFAKLLDFGIVRAINPAWQRPDITRVDQVLGTPAYLSPEQAAGGQPDPRWDLWALATILYELLCGKLPFRLESLVQVTDDIINCRLTPLRSRRADLPPWIYDVINRAHHPRLDQRYNSATSFLQALESRTARPEGDEGAEARTMPFLRVDLQTPPPQLVAELVGPPRASGGGGPGADIEPEPTRPWPLQPPAPRDALPAASSTASDDQALEDATAPHPRAQQSHAAPPEPGAQAEPHSRGGALRIASSLEVPLPSGQRRAEGVVAGGPLAAEPSVQPEPIGGVEHPRGGRDLRHPLFFGALVLLVLSTAVLVYLLLSQ